MKPHNLNIIGVQIKYVVKFIMHIIKNKEKKFLKDKLAFCHGTAYKCQSET